MKKIATLLLLILVIGILAVPASAAGAGSLIVSSNTVNRGGTVTVTVYVSNMPACRTGGIEVSYGDGLELVSGEWLMGDTALKNFNVSTKDGVFALNDSKKLSGNIFRFTFKAKVNAAFTSNKVTVKLLVNNEQVSISKAATITVACTHKWSDWAQWSATTHYHKCSICGKTETPAHDFDNPCDTACNICGFTRSTTHQFSQEWTADETGHWYGCVHCGEKSDFVEHTPGEEAGEYTDQVCTVCNYVIVAALGHQHKYDGTYLQDENLHWQICQGCGEETEHTAHEFSDHCDDDCNFCGYGRRVLHNEKDRWSTDSNEHWKVCDDCGDRVDVSKHFWENATVTKAPKLGQSGTMTYTCAVCQRIRVEEIPALNFFQAVPWWGFLLIGLALGGGIAVGTIALVAVVKAKKKGEGKFSDSRATQEL